MNAPRSWGGPTTKPQGRSRECVGRLIVDEYVGRIAHRPPQGTRRRGIKILRILAPYGKSTCGIGKKKGPTPSAVLPSGNRGHTNNIGEEKREMLAVKSIGVVPRNWSRFTCPRRGGDENVTEIHYAKE